MFPKFRQQLTCIGLWGCSTCGGLGWVNLIWQFASVLISWDKKLLPARSTMIDKTLRARVLTVIFLLSLFPFPRLVGVAIHRHRRWISLIGWMVRGAEKSLSVPFCLRPTFLLIFLERSYNLAYPKDLWTLTGRLMEQIFVNPLVFLFVQIWWYPAIDI